MELKIAISLVNLKEGGGFCVNILISIVKNEFTIKIEVICRYWRGGGQMGVPPKENSTSFKHFSWQQIVRKSQEVPSTSKHLLSFDIHLRISWINVSPAP